MTKTRKRMWILAALSTAAVLGLAATKFSDRSIETPEYEVLQRYGEVEIRRYPQMLVAQTSMASASFDAAGSNGFRTVANYIFGGNERNQKIAMTAPVVMNMGDSATMYFVMPKQYGRADLPQPNSSAVKITEVASKVLAVVRFGGFSNDRNIRAHCDELAQTLREQGIEPASDFMYMGYNAPWDVFNRRNEVAVEVVWRTDNHL
jgi:hypothetical protein